MLLLGAAAVTLLLSCGDDPQPAAPGTATTGTTEAAVPPPTDTTEPTAAGTAEPTAPGTTEPTAPDTDSTGTTEAATPPPTDTTEPTAPDDGRRLRIDGETTWQDVFDTFAESEQSCSREALGGERLRSLLEQRVVESDIDGGEWSLFSCLEPQDAEYLLLSGLIAGLEWDEGLVVDAEQRACLREWISGIDWTALEGTEDPAAFGDLMSAAVNCLPDLFLTAMLDEMGMGPDELSAEQTACLQEWISGIDWAALDDTEDSAAFGDLITGVVNCLPDLFLTAMLDEMGMGPDELSAEQTACLQEWISGIDWTVLDDENSLAALAFGPAMCIADGDADDHANLQSGATAAAVGEPAEGTLDYDGDLDFFVFEAQQGRIYEIRVTPGTLGDPTLGLSDADGAFLGYNDDDGETLASRLTWQAPASGNYYPAVGGYGTGSYTLTVTLSDITDDHANVPSGASPAAVGEPAEGTLDYDGDVDVFVFEAQQGRIYEIHVTPGTLGDPTLELSDADGAFLGYNDDDGETLASRLDWQAPASGNYYLAVGGYGTGSYTLSVGAAETTGNASN